MSDITERLRAPRCGLSMFASAADRDMYNVATREEAADEIDRLRADLNAAKTALENQIAHTTNIANLCARQRAWIDGVMNRVTLAWSDRAGTRVCFNGEKSQLANKQCVLPLITRPAPFEDK